MVRYSASGGQVIRQIRETPPDSQGRGLGFPRLGPQIQAAELGNRGKEELQAYLSEITGFPEREYFRPNFFVNTPDILPFHLQSREPWIFKARVALAATLSSNYGIYNGFGLVEYEPIPGKEEYLNSDKYELKVREGHDLE